MIKGFLLAVLMMASMLGAASVFLLLLFNFPAVILLILALIALIAWFFICGEWAGMLLLRKRIKKTLKND